MRSWDLDGAPDEAFNIISLVQDEQDPIVKTYTPARSQHGKIPAHKEARSQTDDIPRGRSQKPLRSSSGTAAAADFQTCLQIQGNFISGEADG